MDNNDNFIPSKHYLKPAEDGDWRPKGKPKRRERHPEARLKTAEGRTGGPPLLRRAPVLNRRDSLANPHEERLQGGSATRLSNPRQPETSGRKSGILSNRGNRAPWLPVVGRSRINHELAYLPPFFFQPHSVPWTGKSTPTYAGGSGSRVQTAKFRGGEFSPRAAQRALPEGTAEWLYAVRPANMPQAA